MGDQTEMEKWDTRHKWDTGKRRRDKTKKETWDRDKKTGT